MTIGEAIRVKLDFIATVDFRLISCETTLTLISSIKIFYRFALFNCKVGTGESLLDIYNGHCPDEELASLLSLKWIDWTSFDITVFQMRNADYLIFTCEVRTYGQNNDLPTSCNSPSRKRRDVESHMPVSANKGTF